jgi:hypothetical protein
MGWPSPPPAGKPAAEVEMSRRRWVLWLAPPIAVAIAVIGLSRVLGSADAGPQGTPVAAGACAETPLVREADGRVRRGEGAWWRLADTLDANGGMTGRRLALGLGGSQKLNLELATETLVSGPVGGLVVVTTDDGAASEVRLVSVDKACSWTVHRAPDVARGAILDPRDGSVLVHLLARDSRSDLGTWRIAAGGGAPELVVGPLPQGILGDRVFSTDYRIDVAAGLLAVQSCSDTECATRIVDIAKRGRNPILLDGPQGQAIGFAGTSFLTWSHCEGLPCPIEAWDLTTRASTELVDRAESAAVTEDGTELVAVKDAARGSVVRIAVGRGGQVFIKGVGREEQLVPGGFGGFAGSEGRLDEVGLVTPNGNPRNFRPAAAEVIP